MFYRRKILLALLEAFGGSLSKNDCQNLLFLFCQQRDRNYYDFFSSVAGNVSLILDQDKDKLTSLEYLVPQHDFQLKERNQSYRDLLKKQDQALLFSFVKSFGGLRGAELLERMCLDFPHDTVAKQMVSSDEYRQIRSACLEKRDPCFFTIGYEGLSIDAYLDVLVKNDVAVLVDVRKNPISRKYGFSKTRLSEYTKLACISYIHLPELGIASDLRHDLKNAEDYHNLFDFYAAQILPHQIDALKRLKEVAREKKRVAITCFEADYHFCHRHKITELLEKDPHFTLPIIHLHKGFSGLDSEKDDKNHNGILGKNTLYSSV
jgi:Protein of unknown function, DUF488